MTIMNISFHIMTNNNTKIKQHKKLEFIKAVNAKTGLKQINIKQSLKGILSEIQTILANTVKKMTNNKTGKNMSNNNNGPANLGRPLGIACASIDRCYLNTMVYGRRCLRDLPRQPPCDGGDEA